MFSYYWLHIWPQYLELTRMHPKFCTPQWRDGLCVRFVRERSQVPGPLESSLVEQKLEHFSLFLNIQIINIMNDDCITGLPPFRNLGKPRKIREVIKIKMKTWWIINVWEVCHFFEFVENLEKSGNSANSRKFGESHGIWKEFYRRYFHYTKDPFFPLNFFFLLIWYFMLR